MIVMKFGGTSVADRAAIERLIAIVRAARQAAIQPESTDWRGPIVVVSALGGVTDRLLGVAAEAGAGDVEGAHENIRALRARHLEVARVIVDDDERTQPNISSATSSTSSSASRARWACCARSRRAGSTPSRPRARSSAAASWPPR